MILGQNLAPCVITVNDILPTDEDCFAWWNEFEMLENIKQHSLMVANVATEIARMIFNDGNNPLHNSFCQAIRASALLHDIAKSYCIKFGGNHAQMGSSWIVDKTGNRAIARGVAHHVYWPGSFEPLKFPIPLIVLYSDKRVRHNVVVSSYERELDLVERYGKSVDHKKKIHEHYSQVYKIEEALSQAVGRNLDEYSFGSGRLVR